MATEYEDAFFHSLLTTLKMRGIEAQTLNRIGPRAF